ncbi:CHAD domain-containing protein [Pseudomarimonas arenosa]|uniref:CHAD domain-containing protein n=1 Tax=Pseudomarimonas arenosa TaxID=2774145 RepID=A0AAW3ZI90_9GAMM|nr:CHAD domain-containing protein [Pseudomarimonas arenosa]MBD8524702.1 CHAD domain-containing protein [Pseudomarimonas arenosa]
MQKRVEKSMQRECAQSERELAKAGRRGKGRDKAVHQLRKSLQRLRAMLHLLCDVDPIHLPKLERDIKRFRRRFSRLRDAAVRLDLARELAGRSPDDCELLTQVCEGLQARLDEVWLGFSDPFWHRAQADLARLHGRLHRVSLATLRAEDLQASLERARKKARKAIVGALGLDRRVLRHRMRCKVRRYAAMRRLRQEWLGGRDALASVLVDLGKRLGREGDLWLSAEAVHTLDEPATVAELRRTLRSARRERVREHDGELAAWLRRCFARKERAQPALA